VFGGDDDIIKKVAVPYAINLVTNMNQIYIRMIKHYFTSTNISILNFTKICKLNKIYIQWTLKHYSQTKNLVSIRLQLTFKKNIKIIFLLLRNSKQLQPFLFHQICFKVFKLFYLFILQFIKIVFYLKTNDGFL